MALVSPGVQVSVIDESFYTPAEPGTVPMIFVASAQDKTNSSGTGTAQGTLAANAGKVFLMTSQRELAETFGDPVFKTDANNNPIHGGETNEYGLQAAYSYLGVANRAFVVRADVDMGQLEASASVPSANPPAGTYWLDSSITAWGVMEWNSASKVNGGQVFTSKTPIVVTSATDVDGNNVPKTSIGQTGDYAIAATTTSNELFRKDNSGAWRLVGSQAWTGSIPTATGTVTSPTTNGVTMNINGSPVTGGLDLDATVTAINTAAISGITASNIDSQLVLFDDNTSGNNGITIVEGSGLAAAVGLSVTAKYNNPVVAIDPHTTVPQWKGTPGTTATALPTKSVWIKTTEPNGGSRFRIKKFNGSTNLWEEISSPVYKTATSALYNLDRAGGGVNLAVGSLYVNADNGTSPVDYKIWRRENAGTSKVTGAIITASGVADQGANYSLTISETRKGVNTVSTATISVLDANLTQAAADADVIAGAINGASALNNVKASVDSLNRLVIEHTEGGEINITDTNGLLALIGFDPASTANLYYEAGTTSATSPKQYTISNWKMLSYSASDNAITSLANDGQLWYSSTIDEVDLMVHNGATWKGYRQVYASTDAKGPTISATAPTTQQDGTSSLVDNDIWISTADLENYPKVYKFDTTLPGTDGVGGGWSLVDNTDQTSENGILFADARYNTSGANSNEAGTIEALLSSDFLDFDAPDPALYPQDMLLWNNRRSGFNVRKFVRNYVDQTADNKRAGDEAMTSYYTHRWVTESANQADGSGSFGRKAQRQVVVQSLQAMVNSNQDIRDDESRLFNVMATPGYAELIGEMVSLNFDRGLSAFVVGDTPFRLTPDATSVSDYVNNVNQALEDNDLGLVTNDEYLGVFYPSGFTSDNFGRNIAVPPSHMMLRTIALSDQVSFPWFAPAGTRRGGITNATSTGYVNSEGEFVGVSLNEGQRDTLYAGNVNPITFITGAGLVNYGQKTRAAAASSLDRINVARLVIYLRSQLNKLARPYVFEPNDKTTRDEIKAQAESLMLELVGNRAVYDFLVVCDETNNTPARIDRNELYLDIAIEPVKAVEFIYIPLRLKNTGEIAGL